MKNRKGMMLLELLIAIALVTAVLAASTGIFVSLVGGMARDTRTVATDRTIDHMLARLRQDVRGARAVMKWNGIPWQEVGLGPGGAVTVSYAVADGNVIRTPSGGGPQECWAVPDATIQLRLWPSEDNCRALEVLTSVGETDNGVVRQKLSRTHLLFFDGIEGRAGK
jgi:type II secretory pathway pseudopilin PulG